MQQTALDALMAQMADRVQFEHTDKVLDAFHLAKVASTYQPTAKVAGYGDNQQRNPNFHRHLGQTMDKDSKAGKPFRSSLITNSKWGMPGEQYFEMARALGHVIPNNPNDERIFWRDQIAKLGLNPNLLTVV